MTLRMPQSLGSRTGRESGLSVLEAELFAEQAAALGRTGRDLEAALARLRASDGQPEQRAALVRMAADAAWRFFVQREASGLFDQRQVIKDYAIPADVLNRVGAR